MLLDRVSASQVTTILRDGDYEIKKRNDQEERIFSFDKSNKFRSDIMNLMKLLTTKQAKQYVADELLNG